MGTTGELKFKESDGYGNPFNLMTVAASGHGQIFVQRNGKVPLTGERTYWEYGEREYYRTRIGLRKDQRSGPSEFPPVPAFIVNSVQYIEQFHAVEFMGGPIRLVAGYIPYDSAIEHISLCIFYENLNPAQRG